ncbi:hypothetical protein DENIS_4394 [Desulfonema ishimotonii]|uniref:Methyl-accepting chemotaxis protein n=1 Tax=Desulfonema ishimotonii TaxID=45657 RepID=A0A401G2E4_9BACT|nr:methyl-accepting chemotaxis protein [Desulfonema ishimotonii]GBC63400.1 hypothetical protein DENIS_4394 [Desulfonema ishimotonii]
MKLNLTIKKMLTVLVLTGVIVVIALAAASSYSNTKLIQSQSRLTGVVLPLESANRKIRVAMAGFLERQSQILAIQSPEELEKLSERSHLEARFARSQHQLEKLSGGKAGSESKSRKLTGVYTDFLKKDAALLESMRTSLELAAAIDQQIGIMDKVGAELQKNAEAISGRVNFAAMREKIALREYVDTEEKTDELQDAVRELLRGDLTRTQKACNDLRLGVSALSTYGRQILLVKEQDSINTIRGNKISQASGMVVSALDVLKKGVKDSDDLLVIVRRIEKDFGVLSATLTEVTQLRSRRLTEQANMTALQVSLKESTRAMAGSLDTLQALAETIRTSAEDEAERVRAWTENFVWAAGLVSILSMIVIGWFIARRIITPINSAVAFADTISRGDLTARIRLDRSEFMTKFRLGREDEIGKLVMKLGEMASNLNSLIRQVQDSGVQVTSSSTELSATAKQQKSIMASQVESTQYVVRSVGEISKVSSELGHTMQQVAAMSGETAEFASRGQADLSRMEAAILRMEEASKSISGRLEAINEKASNITSVVTTITKVADQTNLLSLNAAIEAEKAGEYGRGFTVVAREIRRLADQTAVATLDIEQMVQDMQTAVSAGVMEMDAFIKEVQRSAEDVARISTQLTRIIEQVKSLSPSFDSVNNSMQFQSESAREINNAMASLGQEVEQTMESLKESFLAIEQLDEAARGLQDEVSRFKVS